MTGAEHEEWLADRLVQEKEAQERAVAKGVPRKKIPASNDEGEQKQKTAPEPEENEAFDEDPDEPEPDEPTEETEGAAG